jgi:hypothetical protein
VVEPPNVLAGAITPAEALVLRWLPKPRAGLSLRRSLNVGSHR